MKQLTAGIYTVYLFKDGTSYALDVDGVFYDLNDLTKWEHQVIIAKAYIMNKEQFKDKE